ncbi:sensor histidine kinase [Paenarthrobacter sp. JL.01a]|uniref:sensor histidine kinase n=1 Tax=Paenarthrobacter sp. JL.01a TaxID=2979324 RepID=UPI0021C5FA52|nr:HAMP domain-containing sensor histidine kinase [Paenarthrobacter sp. JL.01a]UXM93593.1 HAMP domain-containing histidine kinase [Paenarthrobacter sp. JL.01a]
MDPRRITAPTRTDPSGHAFRIRVLSKVQTGMREARARSQKLRAALRTVRVRVLATVLAFLAVGLFVAGTTTLALDLRELNSRVSEDLLHQSERLRNIVDQGLPDGRPYSSLDDLFTVFLRGGTLGRYESVMATVAGGNTFVPAGVQARNLGHPQILETVLSMPLDGTALRDVNLDGRTVRLAVTPVSLEGNAALDANTPKGVLVAGNEIGQQREQMVGSFGTFAAVSVAILLLAGGVGYTVTGHLFVPIRRLRQATENTTFEDVSSRVSVPPGDDDVSRLAADFNRMLDRLEAGIEDQRRFVDDASHELRTPLTIIGGHLQLLQPSDALDVADTRVLLLEEVDRMQSLVNELLVLARSGRPGFIRPDWVDVDSFLEAVMERVRVLGDRHWQIEQLPGGWFQADLNRLTQAIEQLAANAVQSTEPGDIISIGAAWVAKGGDPSGSKHHEPTIEIWVADTGCGISAEDQERIFDRFARAGVSRGPDGSGLGLPIVKAIAEAHGGSVRLSSRVNVGSRFVLTLPSGTSWLAS